MTDSYRLTIALCSLWAVGIGFFALAEGVIAATAVLSLMLGAFGIGAVVRDRREEATT